MEKLKKEFVNPSKEFSPIPFWFWNDDIKEKEILYQMKDFKEKGVDGVVIHPRIGIPKKLSYMSEHFLKLIRYTVEEAEKIDMSVVLYDEAMYPSGSAHGEVVRRNPLFASKGLKRINADEKMSFDDTDEIIYEENGTYYVSCFTKGTIRGIHFGEDDCQKYAPPSADLLNEKAVKSFIEMTHEKYYSYVGEHFGKTVIGIFTDEPNIVGRAVNPDVLPWTDGFLEWYLSFGGKKEDIPKLWENGKERELFDKAVLEKLKKTYYEPVSKWCEEHKLCLMGHPGKSDDTELLEYFHIPGQDVVLRLVAPENNKGLTGIDSVQAKCTSDHARHSGKRRNSNECFGACNKDNIAWNFTASDMKWYIDWLCVRGVNMIIPHAFYYSVRGKRKYERPPDVGPNNIWWNSYKDISTYIKRLCYMMTDSKNTTHLAVVCENQKLDFLNVEYLYKNQIEFNYLEKKYINPENIQHGFLKVNENKYSVLFLPPQISVDEELISILKKNGISVIHNMNLIDDVLEKELYLKKYEENLRVSHIVKNKTDIYFFSNEGEAPINNEVVINNYGSCELWYPYQGLIRKAEVIEADSRKITVHLKLQVRESVFLVLDKTQKPTTYKVECEAAYFKEINSGILLVNEEEKEMKKILEADEINEYCELYINGQYALTKMWEPYSFDITNYLKTGKNKISLKIKKSLSEVYGKREKRPLVGGKIRVRFEYCKETKGE